MVKKKYSSGSSIGQLFTILKKIPGIIKKKIIGRHKYQTSFKIKGAPSYLLSSNVPIESSTLFIQYTSLPMTGSPKFPMSEIERTYGSPSFLIEKSVEILGIFRSMFSDLLGISGSSKHKVDKNIKVTGTKDLKKVIWELLEDEDE